MGYFKNVKITKDSFLYRVAKNNAEYNEAAHRRAAAVPLWRKLLYAVHIKVPSHDWQWRQDLHKYWPDDDWYDRMNPDVEESNVAQADDTATDQALAT